MVPRGPQRRMKTARASTLQNQWLTGFFRRSKSWSPSGTTTKDENGLERRSFIFNEIAAYFRRSRQADWPG
jgi:hypothetical protein